MYNVRRILDILSPLPSVSKIYDVCQQFWGIFYNPQSPLGADVPWGSSLLRKNASKEAKRALQLWTIVRRTKNRIRPCDFERRLTPTTRVTWEDEDVTKRESKSKRGTLFPFALTFYLGLQSSEAINYVLNSRYRLLININSLIISNLTLWNHMLTSQRRYSDQELILTPKHGKRTQNTRLTENGHSSISSDVAVRVSPYCPYVTSASASVLNFFPEDWYDVNAQICAISDITKSVLDGHIW